MELHERLDIFLARLQVAPACHTAEEALALVCRLIEEVEDEYCPIPRREPPPTEPTGHLYAPRADSIRTMPDGTIYAKARRHRITCLADGSITITSKRERSVAFAKLGAIH